MLLHGDHHNNGMHTVTNESNESPNLEVRRRPDCYQCEEILHCTQAQHEHHRTNNPHPTLHKLMLLDRT